MLVKVFLFVFICLVGVGVNANYDKETVERYCKTPPRDGMLDQDWVSNYSPKGGWYFPLFYKSPKKSNAVDELAHQHFEGVIENRPFCPRLSWSQATAIISYYDQDNALSCETDSPFSFLRCKRNITASTDKNQKEDELNVFITLTDNQSYMFFYRCWDDGHRDWGVVSTTKYLNENTKELILNEVQTIGFDRNEYDDIDYKNCGDE